MKFPLVLRYQVLFKYSILKKSSYELLKKTGYRGKIAQLGPTSSKLAQP